MIKSTGLLNPETQEELKFYYRPDTSDEKVFTEIFEKKCYQKKSKNFDIDIDETWIDLGGHIGLFAIYAISKGAKKVIVYEADPDNFNILKQNIQLNKLENKIECYQSAVVADDILGDDKTINLWKSKNRSVNYRNSINEKSRGTKIIVPAIGFNSIITKNIDGLKIDIEGAEVDILTSNSSNYQNIKKLTFEFTLKSHKLALAEDLLKQKGFILNLPPSARKIWEKGWIDYIAHGFNYYNILLNSLRNLKFPKTTRKNIADKPYEGFVLGQVISWAGKGEKAGYKKLISNKTTMNKYKDLYDISLQFMKNNNPEFNFTSIQYNKNQQCKKHKDKNNVGISTIIGFGDYTGGELIVYDENGENPVAHDIKNKFLQFDGSKYPHETAPFEGERYTLVFYEI
jgi:FkbM family methyltransferase